MAELPDYFREAFQERVIPAYIDAVTRDSEKERREILEIAVFDLVAAFPTECREILRKSRGKGYYTDAVIAEAITKVFVERVDQVREKVGNKYEGE